MNTRRRMACAASISAARTSASRKRRSRIGRTASAWMPRRCAWHEQSGLPIFSWSSQARGFFTGRFTQEDRSDADLVRVFYNDDNWERYRRAEELGKQKGYSTIQIALAYVLNQSFPTAAIIGARNEAEMKSCQEATTITLTPEEIRWLDLRTR